MHNNSQLLFERYAVPRIPPEAVILEVGPSRGSAVYRKLLPRHTYHYADIDNKDRGPGQVRMTSDYALSAPAQSFDIVYAGQVIEHVRKPWLWVPELARVTRTALILIAPVSWPYHPGPYDCWRIFSDGMQVLLECAGLKCEMTKTLSLDGVHTDTIGIGVRQ